MVEKQPLFNLPESFERRPEGPLNRFRGNN